MSDDDSVMGGDQRQTDRAREALAHELRRGALTVRGALEICAAFEGAARSSADRAEGMGRSIARGLSAIRPARRTRDALAEAMNAASQPTLRQAYEGFMRWYGLQDGFLPGSWQSKEASEQELHILHDILHVLGEYETSDTDEVALHSFMFGHCTLRQARFLRSTFDAAPSVRRFKHLLDVRDAVLSPPDFERGARARGLLALAYEEHWDRSVDELRRALGIEPRPIGPRVHENTCGGSAAPFWTRARQLALA